MSRALLVLLLALTGCSLEVRSRPAEPAPPEPERVQLRGSWSNYVEQVAFPDAGVTCWVFSGIDKGGISCLPTGAAAGGQP